MTKEECEESLRRCMYEVCTELGFSLLENAGIKLFEAILHAYYSEEAAVITEDGVALKQTDRPTDIYGVCFTITGTQYVKAESEEAAHEWVKFSNTSNYADSKTKNAYVTVENVIKYKTEKGD